MYNSSPLTLAEQPFLPGKKYIYIPEVDEEIYDFIKKIWNSFVNKIVSMTFTERDYCFDYGIFEVIDGEFIRIVAISSQIGLVDIAKNKIPKEFAEFRNKTRPTRVSYQTSLTSSFLRESIVKKGEGVQLPIAVVNLREDKRVHPKLKEIIPRDMNYIVGIAIFFADNPVGVLWGVRKDPLKPRQKMLMFPQLHSLSNGISTIMNLEFNRGKYGHQSVRKNIEKLDTNSTIQNLFYTRRDGQAVSVRSIIGRSTRYNVNYRLDASYIIPTSKGFSISLKRFLPEYENKTKKTLLMIPGFFCRRSLFDLLGREMAFRYGYKVISLDYRGRDKRTLPKNGSYDAWSIDDFISEDFPRALTWIKEQYPDDSIVVYGHSMGGMIARYYTGSYAMIKKVTGRNDLPDPENHLAGIVSIASPDCVDLKLGIPCADLMKMGAKLIPDAFQLNTISGNIFNKLLSLTVSTLIPTINLNRFFTYINGINDSMRQFTYDLSTQYLSLHDFVGFSEVTAPELYLFMEDILCEESTKVMIQFFRSQLFGNSILSFDGKINYKEDLKNIKIPVYHISGSMDVIAPQESIDCVYNEGSSAQKQIKTYPQGHLGLIMHPETVREIARTTDQWIGKLR